MRIKKELLTAILFYLIGLAFILLIAWNVKQYNIKYPNQNINIQTQ